MNYFKNTIAVLVIITVAGFLIPLMIKGFFLALLYMMTNPVTSLVITGAFLLGMFFNAKADKLDEKINSL